MDNARTILLLRQLTSTTAVTPPLVVHEPSLDSAYESNNHALELAVTVTVQVQNALAANNTTDIDALLVDKLGPRRKDMVSAVLLTIVYSLIFLSGVIGNVCTCLVIAKTHSMQTTTNYYLFSLAVSDLLLILIGLPPELYSIWEAYPWRLGETFCYLRQTVLESTSYASSYASVLTITSFTVERYLAICHPLLAHKISALSRAVKIIISIWTVSLLLAVPYAVHTRLYNEVYIPDSDIPIPESLVCSIPYHFLEGFMYYMFQISTFLFFIGPVTVIIILYILIGLALRRSPLNRGSADDTPYSSIKSSSSNLPHQPRKTVIRMLVAVTVAFIVCWAPFHAQRLMVLYVPKWTPELLAVQSHIFYISGVLYFVSATVNPILYNVISKRYRAAFKQTIFPCCFYVLPSVMRVLVVSAHRSRPGVQHTLSMARHSERYSKAQALVVLRNEGDQVKMVYSNACPGCLCPQTIFPCCFSRPGVQHTLSMARHSERYSKAQALVVLRNEGDQVKMVYRQDSAEPVTTYDTISLGPNRRRTLSSDGAPFMEKDKRRMSSTHDKRKKSPPTTNGSVRSLHLNGNSGGTDVTTNLARQDSNPLVFGCRSLDLKKSAERTRSNGEECIQLLEKEQSKNHEMRESTARGNVGSGECIVRANKKPLKSCLRHSRNDSTESYYVIENPSVGDVSGLPSTALKPENGSFAKSCSISALTSPLETLTEALSADALPNLTSSSKPQSARTSSSGRKNGASHDIQLGYKDSVSNVWQVIAVACAEEGWGKGRNIAVVCVNSLGDTKSFSIYLIQKQVSYKELAQTAEDEGKKSAIAALAAPVSPSVWLDVSII
ncbi:hypothetical protein EGW08_013371 [Elysia chlorotica]|uniref:G-protein coupled receptors family 1 profile domain-containing protein n=1 Tax=Elysia chlorotica TaxID=188477 RepID=A0A433TBF0_ELYCH|nr:hypothetical protein EGW08_013371 [Elysia chlorotica]